MENKKEPAMYSWIPNFSVNFVKTFESLINQESVDEMLKEGIKNVLLGNKFENAKNISVKIEDKDSKTEIVSYIEKNIEIENEKEKILSINIKIFNDGLMKVRIEDGSKTENLKNEIAKFLFSFFKGILHTHKFHRGEGGIIVEASDEEEARNKLLEGMIKYAAELKKEIVHRYLPFWRYSPSKCMNIIWYFLHFSEIVGNSEYKNIFERYKSFFKNIKLSFYSFLSLSSFLISSPIVSLISEVGKIFSFYLGIVLLVVYPIIFCVIWKWETPPIIFLKTK